ncbi:uncharacterized protein B0H18DRAFT_1126532 [Fomitopsis serialis]|uniref:uncharacterized protein n=1 Tax=Fomitopsis serialis TaxID=139415 RepID=UPI002008EAB5|nr:uncharacterized protein B0H18DRAFT_1126532 [Neoantrodia serialis]KAH9913174.1 hypothetical protein B0H18DRAFT_1126532 [Neoantrodia serialis]
MSLGLDLDLFELEDDIFPPLYSTSLPDPVFDSLSAIGPLSLCIDGIPLDLGDVDNEGFSADVVNRTTVPTEPTRMTHVLPSFSPPTIPSVSSSLSPPPATSPLHGSSALQQQPWSPEVRCYTYPNDGFDMVTRSNGPAEPPQIARVLPSFAPPAASSGSKAPIPSHRVRGPRKAARAKGRELRPRTYAGPSVEADPTTAFLPLPFDIPVVDETRVANWEGYNAFRTHPDPHTPGVPSTPVVPSAPVHDGNFVHSFVHAVYQPHHQLDSGLDEIPNGTSDMHPPAPVRSSRKRRRRTDGEEDEDARSRPAPYIPQPTPVDTTTPSPPVKCRWKGADKRRCSRTGTEVEIWEHIRADHYAADQDPAKPEPAPVVAACGWDGCTFEGTQEARFYHWQDKHRKVIAADFRTRGITKEADRIYHCKLCPKTMRLDNGDRHMQVAHCMFGGLMYRWCEMCGSYKRTDQTNKTRDHYGGCLNKFMKNNFVP